MASPKSRLFNSAPTSKRTSASDFNPNLNSDLNAASEQTLPSLLERALTEIDDSMDALALAEQAMRQQNDALEAAQHALREERLHYQALVQALPFAVLVTNPQGLIRAVSPAAAKLLGVGVRYLTGKPLSLYAHPSERWAFMRELTQMLVQEGRLLRKGKGLSAACAKSSTIKNERGETVGLLWVLEVTGSAKVSGAPKADLPMPS